MNWRGRYAGGGSVVTARRWWWPPDRKAARLSARVIAYVEAQPGVLEAQRDAERRFMNRVLFGSDERPDAGA